MCEALKELFADELKESEVKGIEQGKNSGIALAKKVFKLMSCRFSAEKIAKECEISVEKVKEILE